MEHDPVLLASLGGVMDPDGRALDGVEHNAAPATSPLPHERTPR